MACTRMTRTNSGRFREELMAPCSRMTRTNREESMAPVANMTSLIRDTEKISLTHAQGDTKIEFERLCPHFVRRLCLHPVRCLKGQRWSTVAASVVSTGAIGPPAHPPVWGARRPELVQPAGAIVTHYEHSEVCATKLLGSFFPLSLPDRNLETSMRIHFHFHHPS